MRTPQHLQRPAALILLLLISCHLAAASDSAADLTGHLKPFGAQGPISEIEHVNGFLSPKEFLNNYVAQNRPVLFKGAAKSSPAFAKWTDEYLMQKTPPRPAGDVFIKSHKDNTSEGFVHFKDFLRDYTTSDVYMASQMPECMLEDVTVPFPLQCRWFMAGGLETHVTLLSSIGSSMPSLIYLDASEGLSCIFRGRKSLLLLNTTRYLHQVDKIIDRPSQGISTADADSIDLESRPEFSGLKFHSAKLEAGDCIYLPSLWVRMFRSDVDANLAVNLWWSPRPVYNISGCADEFNTALGLDRVFFGSQLRSAKTDCDVVRDILGTKLHLPTTEADVLSLLSMGDPDGISAAWPQFPDKVRSLFRALDADKDGQLTEEELGADVKHKFAIRIRKLTLDYNVEVFAMHQWAANSGSDVGRLPKLFAIEGSDKSVYSPERSWSVGEPEPDAAESEKTDGADDPSAADKDDDDDDSTSAKDEL